MGLSIFKHSLMKPLPLWLNLTFLIIAIIGFVDASYLTIAHYSGSELACGTSGGCDIVTTSVYATVGGIPVALLGAIYYLTILLLTIAYIDQKQSFLAIIRSYLTWTGFLASLYFVSLQLFVLEQICRYCMVSAATSTLLFILGMYTVKKFKAPNLKSVEETKPSS